MASMTPEQHAEHKALAQELIDMGQVRTWRDLGAAFGISPQAAQMRFGGTYGLAMPGKGISPRHLVSVSLDPDLDSRLEKARLQALHGATGRETSRASIVRRLLETHLPA